MPKRSSTSDSTPTPPASGENQVANRESFELSYRVVESDIDEMNHVNNLEYLRWTLKAAGAHSRAVGWPSSRFRAQGSGFIVRSHSVKYRLPALLNDDVVIRTWIADMQKVSSVRKYHIVRTSDGKRLADVETNWVFVDFATTGLLPIPPEVRSAFGWSVGTNRK